MEETMPNWVENKITIEADANVLDEIQNQVRTTYTDENGNEQERHLIATTLIPMPEEIRNLDGTETNIRRFKDLDGNIVKVDQIKAMTFYNMNDEELLGEGFTMETLTEDELKELDEKYGAHDWYNWNIANYGTKWGDVETRMINRDKESLEYTFDTAWAPAYPLIEKISKKYTVKKIEYRFFSMENGDKGSATFNNDGRIIRQEWEELDESLFMPLDLSEPQRDTNKQLQDSESPF
jgi:hypothetical protein